MSSPIAAVTKKPVALITGGGQRIGAALARAFAREGFSLALSYRGASAQTEELVEELMADNIEAQAFHADLSRPRAGERLVDEVGIAMRPPQVAICNAAAFASDSAAGFDEDLFDLMMAVNTRTPLSIAKAMARNRREGSLVINILDGKVLSPNADFLSYTLSKITLAEATRLTARSFDGLPRVNGIAPGLILPSTNQPMDRFLRAAAENPAQRIATPEDIAATAVMFWRAKGINGQVIAVDGGQSLLGWSHDPAWYARKGLI